MDTWRCFEVCVFHSERQEVYDVISKEQEIKHYYSSDGDKLTTALCFLL